MVNTSIFHFHVKTCAVKYFEILFDQIVSFNFLEIPIIQRIHISVEWFGR